MKILGIEFGANKLNFVLIEAIEKNIEVVQSNRLELTDTRSIQALRAFQDAVNAMLNSASPEIIGIKDKPENGRMRAGAAALKMEGIVLANASCDVDFVSGKRINTCSNHEGLKVYLQPAFKAAIAAFQKHEG
jgi:hypothetical protein